MRAVSVLVLADLEDGMSDDNVVDAVRVVHGGVHGDFQPNEYQRSKAKN